MSGQLFSFLVIEGTCAGFVLLFRLMAVRLARSPEVKADAVRVTGWYGVAGNVGAAVSALAAARWLDLAGYVACAALWALWARRRRGKRRAAKSLGAKSRALRDALVRRAREVAQPRPVLRPVPVPG